MLKDSFSEFKCLSYLLHTLLHHYWNTDMRLLHGWLICLDSLLTLSLTPYIFLLLFPTFSHFLNVLLPIRHLHSSSSSSSSNVIQHKLHQDGTQSLNMSSCHLSLSEGHVSHHLTLICRNFTEMKVWVLSQHLRTTLHSHKLQQLSQKLKNHLGRFFFPD